MPWCYQELSQVHRQILSLQRSEFLDCIWQIADEQRWFAQFWSPFLFSYHPIDWKRKREASSPRDKIYMIHKLSTTTHLHIIYCTPLHIIFSSSLNKAALNPLALNQWKNEDLIGNYSNQQILKLSFQLKSLSSRPGLAKPIEGLSRKWQFSKAWTLHSHNHNLTLKWGSVIQFLQNFIKSLLFLWDKW